MKPPIDPLYSPLLGCVLPRHAPQGLSEDEVRACWDRWGPKAYDPTQPRVVRLGASTTDHCIHPDDVFMTRLPEFRPKSKGGRK